ncbi:uncharacterized mitochondrial protein AtMg00810-like [Telopea speciosissima]|uniref:uncharacterized mitochondrial protein AtMg00810-like n=1 Tax=Telopea speciosissima TaxID=54955 RepID=UPI001CC4F686|nr:uncharacterized mitochondrial protein AtMg00810-like [Telopea speciosissima]
MAKTLRIKYKHLKFGVCDGEDFEDKHQYKRLVEKLIYLTVTCPDISFAVGVISPFMENPKCAHWDAYRILRYLKGAPGKGLLYHRHGQTNVVGYWDADWAGATNDRRSTPGYCTFGGGILVSRRS